MKAGYVYVGAAVRPRTADELFLACDAIKRQAEAAIARNRQLANCAARLASQAQLSQLASGRRAHYATVNGTIRGTPVAAVIRGDGTVVADPIFRALIMTNLDALQRDVALAKANGDDPLSVTVAAARSCERVGSLVIHCAAARPQLPDIRLAACARGRTAPLDDELPAQLAIEVSGDEEHVISLRGELDIADANKVRDVLLRTAGSRLVVDLSALTFIDARGISAIVAAHSAITEAGHSFSVRGAHGIVRRVFELTELESLLDG